jgi:integrase
MRNRGQIQAKADGKWLVRVYIGRIAGVRKYASKVVTGTFKQADQELTKMLREQDTGTFVEPAKLPLADYLTQWLASKTGLAAKTHRDYTHRLEKDVIPTLGPAKLAQITALMISRLYGSLSSDRKLSSRTIRYTHTVLSQALEQAVVWQMIARNPCEHVELPRMKHAGGGDTLSFEETAQFLDHNEKSGDRLFALWRVLLTAGLRPQEALALRWSDFTGSSFTLRYALKETAPGKWESHAETKTGDGRQVPLSAETSSVLSKHRVTQAQEILKQGALYTRNDLIFATRTGHHFTPPNIRKWWKRALTAAKVRSVRLYDARHTNISQELAAGANPVDVAQRHGHDVDTMLRTYAHVVPGLNATAPAAVERRLQQARA